MSAGSEQTRSNDLGIHVLEAEAAVVDGEHVLVHERDFLCDFLLVDERGIDLAQVRDPSLRREHEILGSYGVGKHTVPMSSMLMRACWLETCGNWMRMSQSVCLCGVGQASCKLHIWRRPVASKPAERALLLRHWKRAAVFAVALQNHDAPIQRRHGSLQCPWLEAQNGLQGAAEAAAA